MKLSTTLIVIGLFGVSMAQQCFTTVEFTAHDGKLWLNNQPFSLKGTNWFGFETSDQVVHGLWSRDYKDLLQFLANNRFNGLRIPFNMQMVLNPAIPTNINRNNINLDLQGLNSLQILDKIIDACADRGMVVMLDLHSFTPGGFPGDGSWYNSQWPESLVLQGWDVLMQRYANKWNVIAADLKNEPHSCTWGTGNNSTDWDLAAARIGNHIVQNSKWLAFVEGVGNSPPCNPGCFWGEDFQGVYTHPISLTNNNKLVFSPHVYGPSVYAQPYFSDPTFPNNMPAIWDNHIGFLESYTGRTVVVGEWGGFYSGSTQTWLDTFGSYLTTHNLTDNFFWCLNPNSGDTGGLLLNDWTTPETGKLALLQLINPQPSVLTKNSAGQVCISNSGSSATTVTATTSSATTTTTATTTTSTPTTATTTTTTTPAAATSTTTTSTSGSATTGSPASPYIIFDEKMNSLWTYSWSWTANISITNSASFSGSNSLQVVVAAYGGLQFGANSNTNTVTWSGTYTNLKFSVKSSVATTLQVWISTSSARVTKQASTSWTTYTLGLATDLVAPASVGNPAGIIIQNSASTPVTLNVDAVQFV